MLLFLVFYLRFWDSWLSLLCLLLSIHLFNVGKLPFQTGWVKSPYKEKKYNNNPRWYDLEYAGNYVDMLTLTNFKNKETKKRIVVITARVHPGETPSSFVCEGIIKFLTRYPFFYNLVIVLRLKIFGITLFLK